MVKTALHTNILYNGDSAKLLNDLKKFPDKSVNLVVTSPPYADKRKDSYKGVSSSKYVEWFVILTGEIFRGSYFARGTKVLNNLPIRKIDFANIKDKSLHDKIVELQKELIKIQDEIDANIGNKRALTPLQSQFSREKIVLEKLLAKLYDLGNDDSLIPLIKELYEAN